MNLTFLRYRNEVTPQSLCSECRATSNALLVWMDLKSDLVMCYYQGLRASSLQFTSQLEFNAIFRDGFPLRLELSGWSKIRDPVTAKFKHVTVIVTCAFTMLRWRHVRSGAVKFPKSWLETLALRQKIHHFCLRDAPTCSYIQLYT